MAETPSIGDLLDARARGASGAQRGPVPARVVSYDSATRRAEVLPLIHPKGQAAFPKVLDVPVWFPGGDGNALVWDLAAGDEVLLVVCECDIAAWKARGVSGEAPTQVRYDLANTVAIPRTSDLSNGAAGAVVLTGADIRLGDKTASDFVALASLVLSELQSIKTAYDLHTHTAPAGGGATSAPLVPLPAPSSPACTTTKAK